MSTCQECKYWQGYRDVEEYGRSLNECRRFPPIEVLYSRGSNAVVDRFYSHTYTDDFCGEFIASEDS